VAGLLDRLRAGEALERQEWLLARREGLGASEVASVCGVGWKTPLEVYLEKTGEVPDRDSPEKRMGRLLEPVVAQMYAEKTGREVYPPARSMNFHPQLEWLFASLDRLSDGGGETRDLECKAVRTLSDQWGESGTDLVPLDYMAQVQVQLAVTGLDRCDLAALFWPDDLRVYEIERDDKLIGSIIRICCDFWQRVLDRDPPSPTWKHPSTPDLIRRMQCMEAGLEVHLEPDAARQVLRYCELRRRITDLKNEQESLYAQILHAMGPAEIGHAPSGHEVRRARRHRKGYTVEATDYWEMRVKEPKGVHA